MIQCIFVHFSTRITYCHRTVKIISKIKCRGQFLFIHRRNHGHIRNICKVRNIKYSLVGVAVSAHNSASIHRENNRQIVQADIMNDLVVSTLQKGRINRYDRAQSASHKSGCKRHCMFFGNSHIKKSFWKFFGKSLHSGSIRHRRTNRYQFFMGSPFFHHPISKYIRIGFFLRFRHFSTFRIKWSDAMKDRWIFFCRAVSFSFFCHYMNQNRAVFHPRSRLQCRQNTFDIMSIDRTDIYDSHFFKKHPRYKQVLQRVFRIFNRFRH